MSLSIVYCRSVKKILQQIDNANNNTDMVFNIIFYTTLINRASIYLKKCSLVTQRHELCLESLHQLKQETTSIQTIHPKI